MKSIPIWAYVIFSGILYGAAEYHSKLWGNGRQTWTVGAIVMMLYGISTLGWLGIMAHKNQLFVMGLVWQMMVTVLSAFVGLFLFSEKLSAWQWIGVVMALGAMGLLMVEK
jgi:drug/metabolite transporter (DMT)-like permease